MRNPLCMPRAFLNGREIESYSYTDRQVQYISRFSLLTGIAVGAMLTAAIHTLITHLGG